MPDWATGGTLARSLVGLGDPAGTGGVPVWVPLLVASGLAGHVLELVRQRLPVTLDLPDGIRAVGYAAAVALLVTLSPGVGKTFIYIQF
jgi:hypothetical protein